MHKHCKRCTLHWKYGKPGTKFTDWCPKFSAKASSIAGHCKLHNGKQVNG